MRRFMNKRTTDEDGFTHMGHHRHKHGGGRGRGGRRRLFDYGDLRLMVLALIKEQPSHGYELIKAIEERAGGSYAPSPGVMYPTLSWLEDMGFASVTTGDGGRKEYNITPEGDTHLTENKETLDAVFQRLEVSGSGIRASIPPRVMRGMDGLKFALRQRIRTGDLTDETIDNIAAALESAAQAVEKS